ncbi:MAG: ribonuclease P protein component [Bacteroidetes bacterium]|nr:ribonuclease P protein component [Bacteroidota bacterium]
MSPEVIRNLKGKKLFDRLFHDGNRFTLYPVQTVWIGKSTGNTGIGAGFSVPKKRFPKAVDRNRLKRQMREAYRLNVSGLSKSLSGKNEFLTLLFIYIGKDKMPYSLIENKIILSLQRLTGELT